MEKVPMQHKDLGCFYGDQQKISAISLFISEKKKFNDMLIKLNCIKIQEEVYLNGTTCIKLQYQEVSK